jgi:hypothetical protein
MWGVTIATVGTFSIVAIRINRRRYMRIGYAQQPQIPSKWLPLSLAYGQRRGTRHRDDGTDPTELLDPAQTDPHRPTGACNAGAHHPSQPELR